MTRRRRRTFAAPLEGQAARREEEPEPPTSNSISRTEDAAPARLPRLYRSMSTGGGTMQVSAPDDPHEVEAAAVAERMSSGSGPPPGDPAAPLARPTVGRSATGAATTRRGGDPTPPGDGEPLPPAARAWAEPRFGTAFDDVRVHTGGVAGRAADQLSANAFTVGRHITFAAGRLAPETTTGRRLLAHELTHVVQGGHSGGATILRQPHEPEGPDHEQTLQRAVEDLESVAVPDLQQSLDAVSVPRVRLAGLSVVALCTTIDSVHRALVPPPAPGEEAPPVLIGPPALGPAGVRNRAEQLRRRAHDLLVGRLDTRQFRGQPVTPGPVPVPTESLPSVAAGDLAPYATRRADTLAWVVRDTASVVTLLRRPSFPETEQWTVIGLLRQHLNPWDFGYMMAVVRAEGVGARLQQMGDGPQGALQSLTETVGQLRLTPLGPTDEPGLLELRAAEGTVRLMQPMSGAEVSAELYGTPSAWADLVVAYNRGLRGRDPAHWLERGTVLVVALDQLVGLYRTLFRYARQMRSSQERDSSDPYLHVQAGDATLAVGNTVTLGVVWPDSLFANARLRWWAENDPVAVRENHLPARVEWPDGTLSMVPDETRNASITTVAQAPGRHVIKCELTMSTGHRLTLERSLTVLTLEEKVSAEARRDLAWSRRPGSMLSALEQERDKLPGGSVQRGQVEARITEIQRILSAADQDQHRYQGHAAHLSGIQGIYVSAEEAPMTVPLQVFVDSDPGYFDALDYVLKLWDFTLQGSIRTYGGRGERPHEALIDTLRRFADDAPYPTGTMRFEINPMSMGYSGLHEESLVCRTDGGTPTAAVLRALSMAALGVGVVSAAALQGEIAIPAFAVSGLLAGAGGAFSLYDRLEHGDFAWDLQTGIDILDIAGAVLTVGVSSAGTKVVGGVGRMSIGGRAQLAVGTVQIGVMAGVHVVKIEESIRSGDRGQVARALLAALGDGVLILIVHRAASRLSSASVEGLPGERASGGGALHATAPPDTGTRVPAGANRVATPPRAQQRAGGQVVVERLRQAGFAESEILALGSADGKTLNAAGARRTARLLEKFTIEDVRALARVYDRTGRVLSDHVVDGLLQHVDAGDVQSFLHSGDPAHRAPDELGRAEDFANLDDIAITEDNVRRPRAPTQPGQPSTPAQPPPWRVSELDTGPALESAFGPGWETSPRFRAPGAAPNEALGSTIPEYYRDSSNTAVEVKRWDLVELGVNPRAPGTRAPPSERSLDVLGRSRRQLAARQWAIPGRAPGAPVLENWIVFDVRGQGVRDVGATGRDMVGLLTDHRIAFDRVLLLTEGGLVTVR